MLSACFNWYIWVFNSSGGFATLFPELEWWKLIRVFKVIDNKLVTVIWTVTEDWNLVRIFLDFLNVEPYYDIPTII